MKKIFAVETYCINCHMCMIYCRLEKSESGDLVTAFNHRPDLLPPSRIQVLEKSSHSFALQCRHCPDPDCVQACIGGALDRNPETGVVAIDDTKCVGCKNCVLACPHGAIRIEKVENREIAIKCDLCQDSGEPACVNSCPNRALVYERREDE